MVDAFWCKVNTKFFTLCPVPYVHLHTSVRDFCLWPFSLFSSKPLTSWPRQWSVIWIYIYILNSGHFFAHCVTLALCPSVWFNMVYMGFLCSPNLFDFSLIQGRRVDIVLRQNCKLILSIPHECKLFLTYFIIGMLKNACVKLKKHIPYARGIINLL